MLRTIKAFRGACCLLCFLMFSIAYGNSGIDYQTIQTAQHIIHLAKFNPNQFEIQLVQANNELKKDTLLSLAEANNALLAINAGFFGLDPKGMAYPSGALKIDHAWISGTQFPRAAIGWTSQQALIDQLKVELIDKPNILPQRTPSQAWQSMRYIVGGSPLLIYEGHVVEDYTREKISIQSFIDQPHARTAIGITPEGHWVIAVVEQRYQLKEDALDFQVFLDYIQHQSEEAKQKVKASLDVVIQGFTLKELANFMLEQGCYLAINLDGGGSSAFYFQGAILTHPLHLSHAQVIPILRDIHTAIIIKAKV